MSDALAVVMEDAIAGTLTRSAGGQLTFVYDEDYRRRPETTRLSLSLPKQIREHTGTRLEAWLWGLLPDNDAVLRRWGRDFHVSASSPFALLSTPVGEDCAGAVRFLAPDRVEQLLDRPGEVIWLTDDEVAERLRDLRADTTAWLGRSFTGQFSLAGAQAKTALLLRDGRWGVPTGATPTTHILKPAVAGLDDHDLNEHLCLDAARRAGLIATRTRIERFGEETAVVVTRYDRIIRGETIRRVHQEDLCQALGIPPTRKYQNEGGPGPGDIIRLLRTAMRPTAAEDAVRRFADALAWNWLIAGTDAHAKNYSLLLAGPEARLAPLYDIASALPYGRHERGLRLAMKLGGDYRVYPHHNPWPRAARELGLDPTTLADRVRELATLAPDAFADATAMPEVTALDRPLPARLVDLVADRARRCRQLLDSTG
ncbi:MAG TPA: type II toxin-antitoxin system HipA family toxin [Conexibacter sp.]|jgi:serine/threonine-protein kinase HipA|nr:type II toxin-antitoxin system HipA family toxin [Conexibacter sp.]